MIAWPRLLLFATCACAAPTVRIATFNTSLNRPTGGELVRELERGSAHARAVAAIVQRVRPDILLLNEVDFDAEHRAVELLRTDYFGVPQPDGGAALDYPFVFVDEVNTGVPSGRDLDLDGSSDGPGDAFGFGQHPGQYGMVVLSRLPIDDEAVRTFRELRWAAMPDHSMPEGFWDDVTTGQLRLSSKSHWDVPIRRPDGRPIHLLASHPTPPVFDGPEDRNGRRNFDEIRFWADYLGPGPAEWIVDDHAVPGGLSAGATFVIAGDLNCDPHDGDSRGAPVRLLLEHPRVDATRPPSSRGAVDAGRRQGGANDSHRGPAAHDTSDFRDSPGPGNLRLDYLLPSLDLVTVDAGVFWPAPGAAAASAAECSDHRLVWIDVR